MISHKIGFCKACRSRSPDEASRVLQRAMAISGSISHATPHVASARALRATADSSCGLPLRPQAALIQSQVPQGVLQEMKSTIELVRGLPWL